MSDVGAGAKEYREETLGKRLHKIKEWLGIDVRLLPSGGYYHTTPYKNLKSIMRVGLFPGGGEGLSYKYELAPIEDKAIFLGRTPQDSLEQVMWSEGDTPTVKWVLLKVSLPQELDELIQEDDYGYPYLTVKIPPKYITPIKYFKMLKPYHGEYEGEYEGLK